jgi:hypothetical protein
MMLPSNPFATRAIRPGAMEYIFAEGQSLPQLMARFEANGWRGQIIGPHGSGKSTLLASFLAAHAAAGRNVIEFALHDGQRRLPVRLSTLNDVDANTVIAVDGYEQLARWNRFLLKRFCRTQRCGLVVTAHESVGLPDLCSTATSVEMALQLVGRLLPPDSEIVTRADIERSFAAHRGNLRDVFFELYDLYEQRRQG